MKLKLISLALTGMVATALFSCNAQPLEAESSTSGEQIESPYLNVRGAEPGVVLVKFKQGCVPNVVTRSQGGALMTGMEKVDKASSLSGAQTMERVFPYVERFEHKNRRHGLDRWYRVSFSETVSDLSGALRAYGAAPEIECVEPIHRGVLVDDSPSQMVALDGITAHSRATEEVMLPFNDPLLRDQWHYDKGAKDVPRNAGIYLFDAWQAKAGDPRVLVAVVDGGVRFDHEDLVDNYWINQAELNGVERVDDDGNGYVDDIHGWNFVDMKSAIVHSSHGTHVAGTVAAVNNNGKGGGGVAGGTGNRDGVKVVSCQVLKDGGLGGASVDNMALAIKYGADIGAVISQNSWGFLEPNLRHKVVEDAIDYFIAEAGDPELFPNSPMRGGVVMFAAGNWGNNVEYYPAAYGPCITVAGSDQTRNLGSYSSYGPYVDITAPGGHLDDEPYKILSTDSATDKDGKYTYSYKYGCSMATPHVSGVAALLVSANYGITSAELTRLILSSVSTEEFPSQGVGAGNGLLDASKHLRSKDDDRAPDPITDLEITENKETKVITANWSVPQESPTDRVEKYLLYHSTKPITVENLKDLTPVQITDFFWFPVGAKASYDLSKIEGLNPKVVNHYAILSSDRWGHTSSISNIARYPMGQTNAELTLSESIVINLLTVGWNNNELLGPKTINLYDRSARVVMSIKVPADQDSHDLNLSKLASGNYTIEVVGDNETLKRSFRKL